MRWLACRSMPVLAFLLTASAFAQEAEVQDQAQAASQAPPVVPVSNTDSGQPVAVAPADTAAAVPPGGNRVLGVLPNYRTADISQEGTVLPAHQKFIIAAKDSFDYPLAGLSAVIAGLGQLTNAHESFGQGAKGYAHRFGTTYADEAIGNMFTEGLFPVLFHEDPRYFRLGTGSISHRTWYAVTRVFVTHTDSGKQRFNYAEWVGNGAAVAISNTYYPDNRTVSENLTKLVTQCGTDAISQVLKEFWPDVKRKFFSHKKSGS